MSRIWKVLTGAVVVAVVLVAAIALWSQNGERRIVAAADQLRIPQDWVVLSQQVQGPEPVCIGDVACPSLKREWRAPNDLATPDFSKVIASSSWNLNLKNDCEARSGVLFGRSCSAIGRIDGYSALLFYDVSGGDPPFGTVTLFLRY